MSTLPFQTDRLIMRAWTLEDADAAFRIYGDANVMHFIGAPEPDVEAQRAKLKEIIPKYAELAVGHGFWAMIRQTDHEIVGTVIIKPLPGSAWVEVGWHLMAKEWGRGYATEAGSGALTHAFQHLELEKIYAVVKPDNNASIRVCERLSMKPRGTTDRFYNANLNLYSISREEHLANLKP